MSSVALCFLSPFSCTNSFSSYKLHQEDTVQHTIKTATVETIMGDTVMLDTVKEMEDIKPEEEYMNEEAE